MFEIRDSRSACKPMNVVGSVLTSDMIERDKQVQADLVQCVSCGAHGVYKPGCGNKLTWNVRLGGPRCPRCERVDAVGMETLLDNMEAGLPFAQALVHRPIKASAGGVLLGR